MTGHLHKYGNYWYVALNVQDPKTGKRKKKWISTRKTRKTEAEAVRVKILAEYNAGTFVEPTKMTVKELLERWLEDDAKLSVSERTHREYKAIINRHLLPYFGARKLQKLSPADIL